MKDLRKVVDMLNNRHLSLLKDLPDDFKVTLEEILHIDDHHERVLQPHRTIAVKGFKRSMVVADLLDDPFYRAMPRVFSVGQTVEIWYTTTRSWHKGTILEAHPHKYIVHWEEDDLKGWKWNEYHWRNEPEIRLPIGTCNDGDSANSPRSDGQINVKRDLTQFLFTGRVEHTFHDLPEEEKKSESDFGSPESSEQPAGTDPSPRTVEIEPSTESGASPKPLDPTGVLYRTCAPGAAPADVGSLDASSKAHAEPSKSVGEPVKTEPAPTSNCAGKAAETR